MICYLCVKSIEDNIFKNLGVKLIKVFLVEQNVFIVYYLNRVNLFFFKVVINELGFVVLLVKGVMYLFY